MGQLRTRIKTSEPESQFDKTLELELLNFIKDAAELLNNGLSFDDNFYAETLTVADTGAANSENAITHTLKKVPTGFFLIYKDRAGDAYDSGTTWTATTIYIKFSAANSSIKLLVF